MVSQLLREEFSHRISTDIVYYDLLLLVNLDELQAKTLPKTTAFLALLARNRSMSLLDICHGIDASKVAELILELNAAGSRVGQGTKLLLQYMTVYMKNVRQIQQPTEVLGALGRWFKTKTGATKTVEENNH
jgi:hypothetical protein